MDIVTYRAGFAAEERRYVATCGEREESFGTRRDAQEWLANASAAGADQSRVSIDARQAASAATTTATGANQAVRSLGRGTDGGLGSNAGTADRPHAGKCDEQHGRAAAEAYGSAVESAAGGSIRYAPVAEPIEHACQNVSTTISFIRTRLEAAGCHSSEYFLSGKDNFRKALATLQPYKGNRKDVPKPVHYNALRDFIRDKYRATVVDGEEADDAIGIRATALGGRAIIVSIDKDLDTIPGLHYNFVKKELYDVSEREASRNFYCQLLTGDTTDNIPGIDGVGVVKARRILKGCTSDKALWSTVLAEYTRRYPDGFMGRDTKRALVEIGQLLYIRKQPGELWSPP